VKIQAIYASNGAKEGLSGFWFLVSGFLVSGFWVSGFWFLVSGFSTSTSVEPGMDREFIYKPGLWTRHLALNPHATV
jgi:hypothetical protein